MSELYSDSIFWIEVGKIKPNPYQPRLAFDESKLRSLADSIRQYGVLQPLVVTRHEITKSDGGIVVEYELVAGERRLRASKIAGVSQVPAIIRTDEDNSKMKLELAIIENLQREDLNPVDRAKAFQKFISEFGLKHVEIAKKIGKSREYVSNTLRLLTLSDDMLAAIVSGQISEGHARALMMLNDRLDEQLTVFKEVVYKKLTVRETERIARSIAKDKIRRIVREYDPEIMRMEEELTEKLGTRVQIESREVGGKITIDFFSDEDLRKLLEYINENNTEITEKPSDLMQKIANSTPIIHSDNSKIVKKDSEKLVTIISEIETDNKEESVKIVSPKPILTNTDNADDVLTQQHSNTNEFKIPIPPAPIVRLEDQEQVSIEQEENKNSSNGNISDSVRLVNDTILSEFEHENTKEIEYNKSDGFAMNAETVEEDKNLANDNENENKNNSDEGMYSVKNFSI